MIVPVRRKRGGTYAGAGDVLDHDETVRLDGPWTTRTPRDAAARFADYGGQWWIAGGWAIDAFAGSSREHGDLDVGIPRGTVGGFVAFASRLLDVWAADGSLTPLLDGGESSLSEECGNLWLRASGADPWEYDVLLEQVHGDRWTFKRDPRITRPLSDCLWEEQQLRFLRPEVQLLLKAENARAKDSFDRERCLPLLDEADLAWLEQSHRTAHPGHSWVERIDRARRSATPMA